ncbi:2Fe-2S iron-sulfur cluster-binding protein [Rhodococcus wratislaviensis]|uniref:2Fe-2S iron-sulfur cluster-binding protein n=1 Tax=Rhodococcus wratislaviensis TaxID=44752 RepID=UPI00364D25B4
MAKVTYVQLNGDSQTIEVRANTSVMSAGLNAGIAGIVAECGGSLACATCHVYVDASSSQLPDVSDEEEEMLEWTASPRETTSRLSCQLIVADEGDEVTVRVPDTQL